MSNEVLKFIEMCQWDSARFLIISDNVFGALIYYSHLLPLIVSLFFASFIFIKNRKVLATRWLFVTTIFLAIWLFSDLILWATEKPSFTMFFWSIINIVEPIIYIGMLFFAYAIIDGKEISFKKKLIIFFLLLPTIILMPTKLGLIHYDLSNCNREAIEGPLSFYGYIIEVIFSLWILGFGIKRFFQRKLREEKKNVALTIFGIVFFLLSFAMGNVVGSLLVDWTIGQYGLFGIPVFVALLAYLVVKYKTFNIKLISAQALVVALWIALFAVLFVTTIENVRIIVSLTLILFLVVGILLVRSVLREVKQKEEIAKMAEDVREAYVIEKKAKEDINKAYTVERRAKEELAKLDKVKDQFLMTTQHNLRTPLTSMMGYTDLLLTGSFGKQNKKTTEVIKKFQILTQGMIKMVNDFLDMAQFQLGRDVVSLKPNVELEPILDEIVTELQFKADSKKLYLKLEKPFNAAQGKPEKVFKIKADREKIKAALFNIVDNAIKYTQKGGVTITLNPKSEILNPKQIPNSNFQNSKPVVSIVVQDTGIGIPKDKLDGIFNQMFERGEGAKKVDATGSGVGLYLAGEIIKSHNGKVWAESPARIGYAESVAGGEGEGKGSVFHIELPVS